MSKQCKRREVSSAGMGINTSRDKSDVRIKECKKGLKIGKKNTSLC